MVYDDNFVAANLSQAIEDAIANIHKCTRCKNMSENELCEICSDETRMADKLCIVASAKDILTIEESGFFNGKYFVYKNSEEDIKNLRGLIEKSVKEIIFAFAPTLGNDALIYFIQEKLKDLEVSFTKIAQGVPTGVNLENVDSLSLAKALESRVKI